MSEWDHWILGRRDYWFPTVWYDACIGWEHQSPFLGWLCHHSNTRILFIGELSSCCTAWRPHVIWDPGTSFVGIVIQFFRRDEGHIRYERADTHKVSGWVHFLDCTSVQVNVDDLDEPISLGSAAPSVVAIQ